MCIQRTVVAVPNEFLRQGDKLVSLYVASHKGVDLVFSTFLDPKVRLVTKDQLKARRKRALACRFQ